MNDRPETPTRRSHRPDSAAVRRNASDESGVGLVEVLVAISIFAVIGSAVVATLISGTSAVGEARSRTVAAELAGSELEEVRGDGAESLTVGTQAQTVDRQGQTYQVTRSVSWVADGDSWCPTTTDGIGPRMFAVDVRVAWDERSKRRSEQSQTLLEAPISRRDPDTGHLLVRIYDENGDPASTDHAVDLQGPESASVIAREGCARFAYLEPGSYTVSLDTAGYVDSDGDPEPSRDKNVTAGSDLVAEFFYDRDDESWPE